MSFFLMRVFRFVAGGYAPELVLTAQWVWPHTVRPVRVFPVRVRPEGIEFGHIESTDPDEDTS